MVWTSVSAAGPNAGGSLLLHANPSLAFSFEGNWCGWSELRDCEDAVTSVPGEGQGVICYVIAAFDDFALPDLKGVSFGIEYSSPQVEPQGWGLCGSSPDDFELPGDGWPSSYTGTSIVYVDPKNRRINEIYWFAVYAYGGNTLKLIENPQYGGYFVDDDIPSNKDRIESFGMLGFGTEGFNPCGGDDATGACCDPDGRCFIQTRAACEFLGGTYLGDNTDCVPNECEPGMGACCIRFECQLLTFDECLDAQGTFMGQGTGCDPTPCTFSSFETSWGTVKTIYRD